MGGVLFGVLVAALSVAASDHELLEPPIIPNATQLEPGRYRSTKTFDETLEYYKRLFKTIGGVRWKNIVTLPTVRAKHLESLRGKTTWEGLNIYELQGDTRIYVIMRDKPKKSDKVSK